MKSLAGLAALAGLCAAAAYPSGARAATTVNAAPLAAAAERPRFKNAIPWSAAEGKPSFQAGRSDGFFIWHEGNDVTIVTTTETKVNKTFRGRIVVHGGGTIGGAGGENLERNDRITMPKPNVIDFRLRTNKGSDQVSFTVKGGEHLVLELGEGAIGGRHVFYGRNAQSAEKRPLVFDLRK